MVNRAIKALVSHEAKSPVIWLALLSAVIAWPLSLEYSPLSATLGSANARDLAYDVAFVLALFGALYSSHRLSSMRWLFERAPAGFRDALWVIMIGFGAFAPSFLALVPLMVLQGTSCAPGVATMGLIALHMGAAILLFERLGFSMPERSLGLILLAVAVPAVLSGAAGSIAILGRVLALTAGSDPGDANRLLTAHHVGSIVAITLFAHCLRPGALRKR